MIQEIPVGQEIPIGSKRKIERSIFGAGLSNESMRDEFEIKCIFILEQYYQIGALAVCLKYGFDGKGEKTYKEVGKHIINRLFKDQDTVSVNCVRQIISRSLRVLRHRGRKHLQKYLDHEYLDYRRARLEEHQLWMARYLTPRVEGGYYFWKGVRR